MDVDAGTDIEYVTGVIDDVDVPSARVNCAFVVAEFFTATWVMTPVTDEGITWVEPKVHDDSPSAPATFKSSTFVDDVGSETKPEGTFVQLTESAILWGVVRGSKTEPLEPEV